LESFWETIQDLLLTLAKVLAIAFVLRIILYLFSVEVYFPGIDELLNAILGFLGVKK